MKELISVASNFVGAYNDKKEVIPQVELIFIASEPTFEYDDNATLKSSRQIYTFRCMANPATIRLLSENLNKFADELEALKDYAK